MNNVILSLLKYNDAADQLCQYFELHFVIALLRPTLHTISTNWIFDFDVNIFLFICFEE